jgi:hypothetical protein
MFVQLLRSLNGNKGDFLYGPVAGIAPPLGMERGAPFYTVVLKRVTRLMGP